jgi:acetyl esterase/lipase
VANDQEAPAHRPGRQRPARQEAESEQIVAAMKEKKIPVTYVVFPDEGHGFARPENNLAFLPVARTSPAQLGAELTHRPITFKAQPSRIVEGATASRLKQ